MEKCQSTKHDSNIVPNCSHSVYILSTHTHTHTNYDNTWHTQPDQVQIWSDFLPTLNSLAYSQHKYSPFIPPKFHALMTITMFYVAKTSAPQNPMKHTLVWSQIAYTRGYGVERFLLTFRQIVSSVSLPSGSSTRVFVNIPNIPQHLRGLVIPTCAYFFIHKNGLIMCALIHLT